MKKPIIYVKRTTKAEIESKWDLGKLNGNFYDFIECDKDGNIDWERNNVHSLFELLKRGNTILID